jgi:hypothetical protein
MAVGVFPGLKMIADEDGIEADLFREAGEVKKLARAELLGGSLVSKSQHARGLSRAWPAANRPLRPRAACQVEARMRT